MHRGLCELFNALEGQPVRIYTDDGRAVAGIVLTAGGESVRMIARHGGIVWAEYAHVVTVEEPQMRLRLRSDHRQTRRDIDGVS